VSEFAGRFVRRAVLITIGALLVAAWPAVLWRGDGAARSLVVGGSISGIVVTASFLALAWSLDKSNRAFMITYVAGFLGRLVILCGAVVVISRFDGLDLVAGAMGVLIVYLTLTALEIRALSTHGSFFGKPEGNVS